MQEIFLNFLPAYDKVLTRPIVIEDGYCTPPEGYGWGIDLKEEALREAHPVPPVPLARVADHIDHVVGLVGIDHVGIGSDYDGVRTLPEGLGDVSRYPALVEELLRRGYSEDDVRKILSGNLMRVWRRVEAVAAELQQGA